MLIKYSHALRESYIYNCAVLKYFHHRYIDDISRIKISCAMPNLGKKAIFQGSLKIAP